MSLKRSTENPLDAPPVKRQLCPYLDTINRSLLDFDFEKLCSVSLSHLNVYACLVCGKYFQGRGQHSFAYTHSMEPGEKSERSDGQPREAGSTASSSAVQLAAGHHVFLNLDTRRFYCLPDNYEIFDPSLEDIVYLLNPTYTAGDIARLDAVNQMCRAFDGNTYFQGFVGLNNIKANDYCNVVFQVLVHVKPLRDYFLEASHYVGLKRPPGDRLLLLSQRFGELMRKLWNPRLFRPHVSPHEMLQAIVLCSQKRFQFTAQSDALELLGWFVNALHSALNGDARRESSIVSRTFRGSLRVYSRRMLPVDLKEEERARLLESGEYQTRVDKSRFFYLTCELPPVPLYPDERRENVIPQVALSELLGKFGGERETEFATPDGLLLKRYELTRLPPYLVLYYKRFLKNQFTLEKNTTLINFNLRAVDMAPLLSAAALRTHEFTSYDLVANIVHDGSPERGRGTYRCHVLHKGTGKWYQLEDLRVTEVLPQLIQLSEAYIQIYEVNRERRNPHYNALTPAAAAADARTDHFSP